MTADHDVTAPAMSHAERAVVAELVVRIRDRGPEPDWHTNRSLFGPWYRYEAELVGDAGGVAPPPRRDSRHVTTPPLPRPVPRGD